VQELIEDLPDDDPVRRYGEQKMELLDRLGHASSKAEEGGREPRSRIGWETIPSSAPAYEPLPKRGE
jgi:RecB family exonuclease